jgi:hypothetical protein
VPEKNGGAGAPIRYFFADVFERVAVDLDEERELVFLALVLADFAAARGFAAEVLEPRAFEVPDFDGVADLALPVDFLERADDFDCVADFDFDAEDLAAPALVPPLERPAFAFVPLDFEPPVERALALVLPLRFAAESLPDFDADDFDPDDFDPDDFDPDDFDPDDFDPVALDADDDLDADGDLEADGFGELAFVPLVRAPLAFEALGCRALDLETLDLEPPVAPEAPAGLVASDCEALDRVPPVDRRAPPELFAPMPDEPPMPEAAAPEPEPEPGEPMPDELEPMPDEPVPMPDEPELMPEEPEAVVPDIEETSAIPSLSRRAVSVTLCAAPVIRFFTRVVVVGVVLLAIETASPTGPTSWAVRSKLGS